MEEFKTEWIEKFDVVGRQIREAVTLFFERRDIVVIHTIVASAHQILLDIGKTRGVESVMKKTSELRRDEVQRFLHSINYPYNFFKHADKDSDRRINIGPLERLTADFIMDAIVMLQRLSGDIPIEAKLYWHWFVSNYHEEFEDCGEEIKKMQQLNLGEMSFQQLLGLLTFAQYEDIDPAS